MQETLSVIVGILGIVAIVVAFKPSLVKMESRLKAFFLFFGVAMVLSLGLEQAPKEVKTKVLEKETIAVEPKESKGESALYKMFNEEEKKEVAPTPVVEEKPKKQDLKQAWREDTDKSKIDYIMYLFSMFPSVEQFKSRHGEKALRPMIFSIVNCIDDAVDNKKYKHRSVDIITDACMRMELLKNAKR